MKVVLISPGFPAEMPHFTRGLAESGAAVFGVGDQPAEMLPAEARRALEGYERVESLWDAAGIYRALKPFHDRFGFDRVECLWEPGMIVAAELREALGVPGMSVAETVPFRDKETMKQVLDNAGIRTPRHFRTSTGQGCRDAAAAIGYPIIIKPIAGAGSADTYRIDGDAQLEQVLPRLGHVEEVSVEEFIEGEEFTFDTVSIDGEIAYFNISWYRPRPLVGRSVEWMSPQTVCLRDVDDARLEGGKRMGVEVLEALGFRTGFTHLEWFLTDEGEAVFGEIGCRPPGARSVDIMNYSNDFDVFRGWGEAVARGTFSEPVRRRYNAAVIFKRARGQGRIDRVEGLERLLFRHGSAVASLDLLPIGAPRRNWRHTLLSDGSVVVRHPHLATCLAIADEFGTDLQLYAE